MNCTVGEAVLLEKIGGSAKGHFLALDRRGIRAVVGCSHHALVAASTHEVSRRPSAHVIEASRDEDGIADSLCNCFINIRLSELWGGNRSSVVA